MEKRGAGGRQRGARRFARRELLGIARRVGRSLCCPRRITDRLRSLRAICKRLRRVDCGAWTRIIRALAFEDQQRWPRARDCVGDDRAESRSA
jgi:hypothetical protein